VIQRGNNRGACFFREGDYLYYLRQLARFAPQFGCDVHAYVLMTNHVHLLLTPTSSESGSQLMRRLGQIFAQYINRQYHRSGTLWEGRYKACIAQSEAYVLACYRYIELNPVRAGIVNHPARYPWSSYRTNADGATSELVAPHSEYLRLGQGDVERRESYRSLFASHLDPAVVTAIRAATNGNIALGSDRFHREIEAVLGRRTRRGKSGRPWPKAME
jgi:putative transposase